MYFVRNNENKDAQSVLILQEIGSLFDSRDFGINNIQFDI